MIARPRDSGFSLIEVILSLGLLAALLISTTWLIVLGEKQVESGRSASEALSFARSIMEEMQGWSFHQTYLAYGVDGTSSSYTIDTRSNSFASKWQPILRAELASSYATIDLQSLSPTSPLPQIDSAQAIRLLVTVHWEEGERPRRIQLSTVKM